MPSLDVSIAVSACAHDAVQSSKGKRVLFNNEGPTECMDVFQISIQNRSINATDASTRPSTTEQAAEGPAALGGNGGTPPNPAVLLLLELLAMAVEDTAMHVPFFVWLEMQPWRRMAATVSLSVGTLSQFPLTLTALPQHCGEVHSFAMIRS